VTENFSPELVNECTRCLCLQSDRCTANCYKVNCEKTWGAIELLRAGWVKPPAYIGQPVWVPFAWYNIARKEIISELREGKISMLQQKADKSWKFRVTHQYVSDYKVEDINSCVFFTKDAGEEALNKQIKKLEEEHGV
jgi:hypothetical protein